MEKDGSVRVCEGAGIVELTDRAESIAAVVEIGCAVACCGSCGESSDGAGAEELHSRGLGLADGGDGIEEEDCAGNRVVVDV